MTTNTPVQLHTKLDLPVIVHAATLAWAASPQPGVERRFLEREGGEMARATSIVRYAPRSSFHSHVHDRGEEYLVLDGVFSDADGDFSAGTYVRNPPGSRHAPRTHDGCTIFVKLRQMQSIESETVVHRGNTYSFRKTNVPGLSRTLLFERLGIEKVGIEQLEPGNAWRDRDDTGGEEILVLEGTLEYGSTSCPPLTWLRIPSGLQQPMVTTTGCRFWVKRGHLKG